MLFLGCVSSPPSSPLHARVEPTPIQLAPPIAAQPPGPLVSQPPLIQSPSYGGPATGGEPPASGANEGPSAGTSIPER
jgi:hypothetical protein